MDWADDPTTQKLWQAFMRFHRAQWHQRSIAGCTHSEIRVLFCIHKGLLGQTGEVKVSDISKFLHVTPPSVTQLLKGLEAKELVTRDVDLADRRAVRLTLTAKGVSVILQAHNAFAEALHGLIAHMGEAESNHLADLMNTASQFYEEKADLPGVPWREGVGI